MCTIYDANICNQIVLKTKRCVCQRNSFYTIYTVKTFLIYKIYSDMIQISVILILKRFPVISVCIFMHATIGQKELTICCKTSFCVFSCVSKRDWRRRRNFCCPNAFFLRPKKEVIFYASFLDATYYTNIQNEYSSIKYISLYIGII